MKEETSEKITKFFISEIDSFLEKPEQVKQ
jgi:hypothetical protein